MKITFTITLMFLIAGCSFNNTEKIEKKVTFFEGSDQIQRVEYFCNNLPYGTTIEFYPNGDTLFIEKFETGVLHDTALMFYESGQILSIAFYDHGNILYAISYTEKGDTLLIRNYKNNSLHGHYEARYPNGLSKTKGHYYNGVEIGIWKYFDSTGNKYMEVIKMDSMDLINKNVINYRKSDTILYHENDTTIIKYNPNPFR